MSAVLESQVIIRGGQNHAEEPSTYLYVYVALQYPAQSGRYCFLKIFYISNWPTMSGRDERPRLELSGPLTTQEYEAVLASQLVRWQHPPQKSREATVFESCHTNREQSFNLHLACLVMWLQFARHSNLELIMDAMLERAIYRLTAVARGRICP